MAVDKEIDTGNKLREEGKFEDAITHYDRALRENPNAFKAHYEKSIALQRSKDYDGALKSLSKAQNLAISRGNRDLIANVLFRYATLYHAKNDPINASKFLNTASNYSYNSKEIELWRFQINRKATKLGIDFDQVDKFDDLKDLPKFEEEPKIEEIKEVEEEQVNKDHGSIETEKKELELKRFNKDNIFPIPKDIRLDWYQSNEVVTVSLFIKNLPKDDRLKVTYHKSYIDIEFPTSPTSEFQYQLGPFYSNINTAESSHRVFATKLEFSLAKETALKWKELERKDGSNPVIGEEIVKEDFKSSEPALQYPTSSKKNIDWSKLTIDDDDEDEKSKDENAFFQELYKSSDEDTRRAMMKSYVESNGTALSTNWDEVSKKTFETTPPEGMEAKKWD